MRVLWITLVAVLIDQATKQAVLWNMRLGQSIPILGDWLKLTYTENPGMAFGITFGPTGMVTMFSIAATLLIIFYMFSVRGGYKPYLASLALILGGALGNIIDRVFYGVLFNDLPLFAGRVVDFIYVNLWRGYVPESVPFLGGSYMALFPIWNVADMAIVIGVVGVLVFQRRFHEQQLAQGNGASVPSENVQHPKSSDGASGAPQDVATQDVPAPETTVAPGHTPAGPSASPARPTPPPMGPSPAYAPAPQPDEREDSNS